MQAPQDVVPCGHPIDADPRYGDGDDDQDLSDHGYRARTGTASRTFRLGSRTEVLTQTEGVG